MVITENEISGSSQGIYLFDATAQITNNTLRGNNEGLLLIQSGNSIIQGNVITGSTGSGDGGSGVRIYNTRPAIVSNTVLVDNVITDNGTRGVWVVESTSGGTFTNNKILNNGGTLYSDVVIEGRDWSIGAPRTPNFSFNVFDDITGTLGVGSYNVNSNGDPILVP